MGRIGDFEYIVDKKGGSKKSGAWGPGNGG